ncbi:MAG: 50S ribosomal protein L24 [Clostridia bacterium]|nr:50S ribosomal protein L24 [Clostridia bacterium]
MSKRVSIKKGDQVIVISGDEKSKKGKVISVDPKSSTAIVEGLNMVTKHRKPRGQRDMGGIIHQEAPIRTSKLMHICDKCKSPTRVGYSVLEDGTKVRVCKKCGETFES